MKVRSVGVWSLDRLYALFGVVVGLIIGIFVALYAMLTGYLFLQPIGGFGAGIGILAVIVLPIVYGLSCLVMGAISALIYNALARLVGGLEINLGK